MPFPKDALYNSVNDTKFTSSFNTLTGILLGPGDFELFRVHLACSTLFLRSL